MMDVYAHLHRECAADDMDALGAMAGSDAKYRRGPR
ncbi:hypothetical protein FBY28_0929 [Arthrobacter sp. SLBN-53]|nr:hypothetical protein FBY28_0929 [Arthrobacter sp. SLBN-53]